ncbi:MAG: PorT family protein [Candidatus Eisenbacteria bacterium]|uniref:PorT family protein n=1 Tax=Eiseniibacteriota bacterium TaxID=2212470 RepID=A0A849T0A9_UNCEI|nr:PorT family protein [Candidatus Eisenbacteria bacterium]
MQIIPIRSSYRFTCLMILLTALPSLGRAEVRAGVEIGVNLSSLSYDDDDHFLLSYWDRDWSNSLTGGVSLDVTLRARLGLETGLRYIRQGNRVEYDTGPIGPRAVGKFRIVQDYLSIPVRLAYRPFASRRLCFSLGPEIALLLSGRLIVEESMPEERSEDNNIKDDLDSSNLSLNAGAGLEFPVENHVGVLSLRYSHGLTGVAKEDRWFSDWKTRGVELLVGMQW